MINLTPELTTLFAAVAYQTNWQRSDFLLTIVYNLPEFKDLLEMVDANNYLTDKGYLYVAYPKKASKRYTVDFGRDDIFPFLHVDEETGQVGNLDMKFSQMMALNEDFTVIGLKRNSTNARRKRG
jgi:predicted DCC family thiol-disulfide oxidoreductase YuxK